MYIITVGIEMIAAIAVTAGRCPVAVRIRRCILYRACMDGRGLARARAGGAGGSGRARARPEPDSTDSLRESTTDRSGADARRDLQGRRSLSKGTGLELRTRDSSGVRRRCRRRSDIDRCHVGRDENAIGNIYTTRSNKPGNLASQTNRQAHPTG